MAYNTVADVRRILHIDSSNEILTDTEIQTYLDEANSELFTEIKKKREFDEFQVENNKDGSLRTNYLLSLTPIVSINKVLLNNNIIDPAEYNSDDETGEVVFSSSDSLNEGGVIRVFYIPVIYKFAELYLTAYNINIATQILNRGGNLSPIAENIEKKKNQYLDVINSRLMITTWV